MQSFLAYIADQYRHKKEDVATDALTYLLSRHKTARVAFKSFVAECGYPCRKYTPSFPEQGKPTELEFRIYRLATGTTAAVPLLKASSGQV